MNRLLEAWRRLPAETRRTLLAGLSVLFLVVYTGVAWKTHKSLGEMRYALDKQAARSRELGARNNLPPSDLGSGDPAQIARELALLKQRLVEEDARAYALRRQFLDYERTDAAQDLKGRLTRLVDQGDMELIGLTHVFARKEDRDRAASKELLDAAAKANRFGRPLLQLRVRSSYEGLMEFLNGLDSLPWIVSPVSTDIAVKVDDKARDERGEPLRWLEVEFKLAI